MGVHGESDFGDGCVILSIWGAVCSPEARRSEEPKPVHIKVSEHFYCHYVSVDLPLVMRCT